jgi:hypothetical protein
MEINVSQHAVMACLRPHLSRFQADLVSLLSERQVCCLGLMAERFVFPDHQYLGQPNVDAAVADKKEFDKDEQLSPLGSCL